MVDTFLSIPEFFEGEIGESLQSRTETLSLFRELGPPDLCHALKGNGRKDLGSYHYVSGVDASSSATLATYITGLSYEMEHNPSWYSSKNPYKLKGGVYCCFNAFSRVDLRVEVCIPGTVLTYVMNARGERQEATPELWQETYLSAVLRAILYADDTNYRLAGYRKLDPIPTMEHELRFLLAAENLFFKGWQLGSEPEVQVATIVLNHLSSGILKYFGDASRWEQAVNLFEKLWSREPEVATLVARSYLGMNQEVKAVQIMHRALHQNPNNYVLLHIQCDFLREKGKLDWAIRLAEQAVSCAPSEFMTWSKLADCYVDARQYSAALFTLNSCPMFTYNERDLHRLPPAVRTHLPIRPLAAQSKLLNEDSANDNETDVALLRLPAPALRGTFASAYKILTKLFSEIGWDELLKCRSEVFVMEEEYRSSNTNENEVQQQDSVSASDTMQRPVPAEFASTQEPGQGKKEAGHWMSFTEKRLCERWLDNLFMVLYEDLRIYTIWRAELAHYQAQSMPFHKTATDWEILGELALRLHRPVEAREAFLECIQQKFSPKAYERLMEHCADVNNVEQTLSMALHLTAYNYRWYADSVYPGNVAMNMFKLIKNEGLSKVSNTLISMKPPQAMLRLMQKYFAYAQEFRIPGSQY
ncbi:hypothetical protein MYAM1_000185 [Malassezia yamatoensis]|uniref:Chaps-domain-containing protein n=1 Tax=Malassezia yamatoensis TaxID=253288 RepID=A0AAJ5YP22_9BASI|nr:hypothetical protein MYAM1_000185 [Malassezia yamatoensis]